ncbi:MAG: uroporphyrinogen-III synthase [Pseudomonadota bacterium]
MRVVVTRPEPDCSRTVALLEQRGHVPVPMPLTRIEDLLISAAPINELPAGAAATTSANAIRAWQKLGIDAAYLTRPLYAVGEQTGQTARDAGFNDVRIGAGDGASLALRIRQDIASEALVVTAEAPLLYAAGRTRHPQFEITIEAANVPYHPVELYDVSRVSYSTDFVRSVFLMPEPVAVLLYSRKAAELFFLAIPADLRDKLLNKSKFFCLSENVVNAIPTPIRDKVNTATHPDEHHLLSLLDNDGAES